MIGPHVLDSAYKMIIFTYMLASSRCKCKSRCHSAILTEEAGPFGYALAPEYLFCQHTEAWSHGARSTAFFLPFIRERYDSLSKPGNIRKEKEALIVIMSWHTSADLLFPSARSLDILTALSPVLQGGWRSLQKRPIFLLYQLQKRLK